MIINWWEYKKKDHVLARVIAEAMSAVDMKRFGNYDTKALDVVLKVNGIEVSFLNAMELLQKQLDNIEKQGIKEGIRRMKITINDGFEELIDKMIDTAFAEDVTDEG